MSNSSYFTRPEPSADTYYNSIESQVYDDLKLLFDKKLIGPDGIALSTRLGEDNTNAIHAAIVNLIITPLISGLAAQFHAVQTLKSTTVPVLERDHILHKMPDIFQLHSQIATMGVNADIYGVALANATAAYKNEDGSYKDDWNPNLVELERMIMKRDVDNDITYREGETPLRDEPISIVDLQGRVHERVRYTNFSYIDQGQREQIVTDIPAVWDDAVGEYIFLAMVALWRTREPDASILADTVINGNQVSDGFDPLADIRRTDESALNRSIYDAQNAQNVPVELETVDDVTTPTESSSSTTEATVRSYGDSGSGTDSSSGSSSD